jgi:hypothetical protein
MAYELWDHESGNAVAEFPDEAAALAHVRRALRRHGPDAVRHLTLAYEDEKGETMAIAWGDTLIDRARNGVPA